MSRFTEEANRKAAKPPCPRCKSPQFVVLVRRGAEHDIFDCRKCVIEQRGGAK